MILFAGPGNNGGDGLAIARQLWEKGCDVSVYHLAGSSLSTDCAANLNRLRAAGIPYKIISHRQDILPAPARNTILIDAIFGTGQSRPLEGLEKDVVEAVNTWKIPVVSIDLPSGLYADSSSAENTVMRARYTLSFQVPKLCFFMPENEAFVGEWVLLDIGLSPAFYEDSAATYELTGLDDIRKMVRPRNRFAHKGSFGTALLMGGSRGMMGAAILASRACLRSGTGKLISRIPACGLDILQVAVPEAICSVDENNDFLANHPGDLSQFSAIGIGPGMGKAKYTRDLLWQMLQTRDIPLVLDADALNIIAEEGWQANIPSGSVITPHIGEFSRLFGPSANHFERISRALELSTRLGIFILVKGQNSFLSTPRGHGYFNSTGNPGMAKAGTGDVLTGMLTGLLAQRYSMEEACRISAFIHGMAGDLAEKEYSNYSVTASDLIAKIGFCYLKIFTI
jgi:NAD(P)H-hydrate epimerase